MKSVLLSMGQCSHYFYLCESIEYINIFRGYYKRLRVCLKKTKDNRLYFKGLKQYEVLIRTYDGLFLFMKNIIYTMFREMNVSLFSISCKVIAFCVIFCYN